MLFDLSVAQHRDVAWVERPRMGTEPPRLTLAPIDVAGPVADALFDERVTVLTSATLALGGGFESMARDLGLTLTEAPWEGVDVGTPFDYARQGILYTPVHLARPGRGISEAALDEVLALTEASRGGMLGLFSSRRAAEEATGVGRVEGRDLRARLPSVEQGVLRLMVDSPLEVVAIVVSETPDNNSICLSWNTCTILGTYACSVKICLEHLFAFAEDGLYNGT